MLVISLNDYDMKLREKNGYYIVFVWLQYVNIVTETYISKNKTKVIYQR